MGTVIPFAEYAAARDALAPPPAWTALPPADCVTPARCAHCETLHRPGSACPWCEPPALTLRLQPPPDIIA